jgi:outer membrane immunogenic protein
VSTSAVVGGTRHNGIFSSNDEASRDFFQSFALPFPADSLKKSAVLGGVQLGYNYQFNRNWLIGFETDFDGTALKGSAATSTASGLFVASVQQRIDWFGTVRARLGYLPTDNLLAYFTGGFAYGSVERNGAIALNAANSAVIIVDTPFGTGCSTVPGGVTFGGALITTPTCFAGSSRNTATGWTLGGGFEYAFWQKWTVKAEYLYVSLGSKSLTEIASVPGPPATAPSTFNANFNRTNFNVARVGLNYHF